VLVLWRQAGVGMSARVATLIPEAEVLAARRMVAAAVRAGACHWHLYVENRRLQWRVVLFPCRSPELCGTLRCIPLFEQGKDGA
jgi:hypothetical protein